MTPKNIIYALADPLTHEIRYVGQSRQGLKRPKQHCQKWTSKHNTYCHNWIGSLQKQGLRPEIRILEKVESKEDLNEAEIKWIAALRAQGARLTNLTDGGGGLLSTSNETRLKLSRALGGREVVNQFGKTFLFPAEAARELGVTSAAVHAVLKRRAVSCRGFVLRYVDDCSDMMEYVEKIEYVDGRPERIRQMVADGMIGPQIAASEGITNTAVHIWTKKLGIKIKRVRFGSESKRIKISRSLGMTPIVDESGIIYQTQAEASRKLNIRASDISAVLHGRQKTAHGHTFRYIES
jgi:hypothetical protein